MTYHINVLTFQCWLKAGENGLLGINLAEEDGGLGADFLSTTIMWEEQ